MLAKALAVLVICLAAYGLVRLKQKVRPGGDLLDRE